MNMRLGKDNPSQLRMFNYLLTKGYKPYEALYTSIYYNLSEDRKTVTPGTYGDGKGWYAWNENDLQAIKKGEPKIESKYSLTVGYNYISRIWLVDPSSYIRTTHMPMPECNIYKVFNAVSEYDGLFTKAYEKTDQPLTLGPSPSLDKLVEKKNEYIK